MKMSNYLSDSDLLNFSETCKSAKEVSIPILQTRKFNFSKSEYLVHFRKLYNDTREGDKITLINFLKLIEFFINKEYITLYFFRQKPKMFEHAINLLDKGLVQSEDHTPEVLEQALEYSDKLQQIYANIIN